MKKVTTFLADKTDSPPKGKFVNKPSFSGGSARLVRGVGVGVVLLVGVGGLSSRRIYCVHVAIALSSPSATLDDKIAPAADWKWGW